MPAGLISQPVFVIKPQDGDASNRQQWSGLSTLIFLYAAIGISDTPAGHARYFDPKATFDLLTCCLGMSPLAEEYRRKAQVAEALAEAMQDQIAKKIHLEAAVRWHQLADQVEENHW
jgi:hypothetical protein